MTGEHRYNLTELLACVAAGLLDRRQFGLCRHGSAPRGGHAGPAHARPGPADHLRSGRHRAAGAGLAHLRGRLAHLLQGLGGLQHARRDVGLPGGLRGLRLPGRRGHGLLWQRQHHRHRRLEPSQGPSARQRRGQRCGFLLLAHHLPDAPAIHRAPSSRNWISSPPPVT